MSPRFDSKRRSCRQPRDFARRRGQVTESEQRPAEVRGLVKRYGDLAAVDQVDLTVEPGDVYGFLGPNGAGKTTTLRMMLGLIRRDAGSIRLFGRDPAADPIAALSGIGVLPRDAAAARARLLPDPPTALAPPG
jgi:ABC-type glutathione transport system ATPase component